ncbi:MAG: DUF4869 domain-containing protein [Lachnospiraceae bacterium]|nr:DUF4869 domain-containing protein [Lachnospiraceae bacterium]
MKMINIYTKKDSNISDKIQYFNDRLFNTEVFGSEFTDNEKQVIEQIDHAKVMDHMKIETDFGIGSILDLSTGCKTAINILRFPNRIISVDECGSNALKVILQFKEANIFMGFPATLHVPEGSELVFDETEKVENDLEYEAFWSKRCRERGDYDIV